MRKPFVYAFTAVVYIAFIVLLVQALDSTVLKETIFLPMAGLGTFVLSAAIMGFLFLSEPLRLFLEGQKHEAFVFFAKIVGLFACFVIAFAILNFFI